MAEPRGVRLRAAHDLRGRCRLKRRNGQPITVPMQGVVFNFLEEVVTAAHGEDAWDAIVDRSGTEGVYTSLGSYPDEELSRLVGAASELLDVPADDVVRWFGRNAMPLFAQRYEALFAAHDGTRSFVLALNDTIHPEVRKLYPAAQTPEFDFDASSPDRLVLEYRSPRRLCAFGEGPIYGCADHYGEAVTVDHPVCLKRGDDRCELVIAAV